MNDFCWLHADQRLTQAVRSLAVSPKPISVRLEEMYWNHLHGLHENELPVETQLKLTDIKNKLTGGLALALNEAVAVEIAKAICDLQSRVLALRQEALEAQLRSDLEKR
jgi:predicted DNA-binding ribbon-helix-helix protein